MNSSMFVVMLVLAVLSVPVLYIKNNNPAFDGYFTMFAFFAIGTLIFFACYWAAYSRIHGRGIKSFFGFTGMFFLFFSVAMGFSVHNSLAVLEGHSGKKSSFVRTPKFNIGELKENWKDNKYLVSRISPHIIIEGVLMLYFAFGLYSAFVVGGPNGDFRMFPFHLMLFFGFGFVFFKSFITGTKAA